MMAHKLIKVNTASVQELSSIPNLGTASAREIDQLRREMDGQVTLDAFKTLKCYKRHPLIVESLDFSPALVNLGLDSDEGAVVSMETGEKPKQSIVT